MWFLIPPSLLIVIIILLLANCAWKKVDRFLPGNQNYNNVTDWQQFDIINRYLVDDTGATFPTVIGLKNQWINR